MKLLNGIKTIIICFICILSMTLSKSFADIYKYVDKDGVIHFTNVPTSSKYKLYIREKFYVKNYNKSFVSYSFSTDKYDQIISTASMKHDLDFSLIKAVIKVESNFNPKAVSYKGAMGLMQLMPDNVDLLNINDPFDPIENIMGGTRLLKRFLNRFNGEVDLALAAYNAGPERVNRSGLQIPPIKETEDYVKMVRHFYRKFSGS